MPDARISALRKATSYSKSACIRASRCQRPAILYLPLFVAAGNRLKWNWTGLDWIWITVSDRPCPTREAPSAARVHPSQVTIGLDRFHVSTSSAFSNQPPLDSLAREEKAPPLSPTNNNHAPNARARMLPQTSTGAHSTGCARSDPSAPSPFARPPPPPPRRMESSADRIFRSPACSSQRWLTR